MSRIPTSFRIFFMKNKKSSSVREIQLSYFIRKCLRGKNTFHEWLITRIYRSIFICIRTEETVSRKNRSQYTKVYNVRITFIRHLHPVIRPTSPHREKSHNTHTHIDSSMIQYQHLIDLHILLHTLLITFVTSCT